MTSPMTMQIQTSAPVTMVVAHKSATTLLDHSPVAVIPAISSTIMECLVMVSGL